MGADLQSEHERYLVEKHFKCPVILFDYPANIKHFTCVWTKTKNSSRDGHPFPGIGEIVGGSQKNVLMFWLKNESLGNWRRRIMVVPRHKKIWLSGPLWFWSWIWKIGVICNWNDSRDVIPFQERQWMQNSKNNNLFG
jgi:hypothetical protein